MAMASFSVVEAYQPVRSISLPCRLHPTSHEIETKLNLLKSRDLWFPSISEAAGGPVVLEARCIQMDLTNLADLYNCIQKKLNSPLTQQSVLQHQRKQIEEPLDMSIELIDICGSARGLLLLMKERVQDLQSALRRKGGESSSIKGDIHAYICFRKKARSDIVKTLRVLKTVKSNVVVKSGYDLINHPMLMVFNELKELSSITICIMQSILLFISMPVLTIGRWSAVSKLMSTKSQRDEKKIISEVGNIDATLCSLQRRIGKGNSAKGDDVQVMKRRLDAVDGSIQVLEDGVDILFSCLIKHRVSLLNLLTP